MILEKEDLLNKIVYNTRTFQYMRAFRVHRGWCQFKAIPDTGIDKRPPIMTEIEVRCNCELVPEEKSVLEFSGASVIPLFDMQKFLSE